MFILSMFNAAVSGMLSSAWIFPRTTKNTQHFFEFLNLIVTVHVPSCVIMCCYMIFNFILFL